MSTATGATTAAFTPSPPIPYTSAPAVLAAALDGHALSLDEFHALRTRATAAKATAYCPYSRFRVGATVLTRGGAYVSGANVENASYPVGTCAERVALARAVTDGEGEGDEGGDGGRRGETGRRMVAFRALAVATDIAPPASPCGMCRQFIREFCDLNMPILMFDRDESFVVAELGQLLPISFGPEALPPPNVAAAAA